MSSKKVPINPILDNRLKNLIEIQAQKSEVSQSELASRLIDATQLFINKTVDEGELDLYEDLSIRFMGISVAFVFMDCEPQSKARRFYVRPSQREWLKEMGGISKMVREIFYLYLMGILNPYLPLDLRLWTNKEFRSFREMREEISNQLEDKFEASDPDE